MKQIVLIEWVSPRNMHKIYFSFKNLIMNDARNN